MTKCIFRRPSKSGLGLNEYDSMCILPVSRCRFWFNKRLNILLFQTKVINEKIYIFLWF